MKKEKKVQHIMREGNIQGERRLYKKLKIPTLPSKSPRSGVTFHFKALTSLLSFFVGAEDYLMLFHLKIKMLFVHRKEKWATLISYFKKIVTSNGMLFNLLGGAVIFISLQHFIPLPLDLIPLLYLAGLNLMEGKLTIEQ